MEVYPAAALKQWGLKARGYKGDHSTARREILKGLSQHLDLAEAVRNACIDHDDKLDALVSAIIALMAELDRGPDPKDERRLTEPLPDKEEEKSLAEKEGWIVLPKEDSLGRLRSRLQELR